MQKVYFVLSLFIAFKTDDCHRLTRGPTHIKRAEKIVEIELEDSKPGKTITAIQGVFKKLFESICPYRIFVKFFDDSGFEGSDNKTSLWRRWYQRPIDGGSFCSKLNIGINIMRKWLQEILKKPII